MINERHSLLRKGVCVVPGTTPRYASEPKKALQSVLQIQLPAQPSCSATATSNPRGQCKKITADILRFLICARDPLRRLKKRKSLNDFNMPKQPSAQIAQSKRSRCGVVQILQSAARSRTVAGSIPVWPAPVFLDRNRNF